MYKNATKCNKTIGKWCKTKHGASKIIDTFETYHTHLRKKSEYFGDALGIMKRLGLFQLMDIQCHYNEKII
jgi:hypothetical protein